VQTDYRNTKDKGEHDVGAKEKGECSSQKVEAGSQDAQGGSQEAEWKVENIGCGSGLFGDIYSVSCTSENDRITQ